MDALPPDPHAVTSAEALEALYGPVAGAAVGKETDRIGPLTARFIAASPFCVLGTAGSRGVHATPRGDAPGFVEVADEKTLLLPDRRGNNRLDALRDVLEDGRATLLFAVPGAGETVRVHGRAHVTTDPALLARFAVRGKPPTTVLVVAVETVFVHCPKAFMRSGLWAGRARPEGLPTLGALLAEHKRDPSIDVCAFDEAARERLRTTLY